MRSAVLFTLASAALVLGPPLSAQPRPSPQTAANELVYQEWRKSSVRWHCAPLGVTPTMANGGTPRRADFSDGWAVAFDRKDMRSAYGVAGTGIRDGQDVPRTERLRRLSLQWPLTKEVRMGRQLAVAGYGIVGAQPYSAENPDGIGEKSLAYVYVDGQSCLYNVWSNLGRKHLEQLLGSLFVMPMRVSQ